MPVPGLGWPLLSAVWVQQFLRLKMARLMARLRRNVKQLGPAGVRGEEVQGDGENVWGPGDCQRSQHLPRAPLVETFPRLTPETSRGHTSAVLLARVLQGSTSGQFKK